MTSHRKAGYRRTAGFCLAVLALGVLASPAVGAGFEDLSDYAFVASRKASEVTVLSTADDRIAGTLDLGAIPDQIIVSENHRKLVAVHGREQRVRIVDLDQGKITTTIDLEFEPDLVQIDDKTGAVAVGGSAAGGVAMIALRAERTLSSISDIRHPTDLMFDRDGRHLFVAHGDAGMISVFDAADGTKSGRIDLAAADDGVVELIRTPGGKTGLALHGESGLISALDLDQRVQVGSTTLPGPVDRGFPSANSQYFLLPNGDDGALSMVSSWTYRESQKLPSVQNLTGVNFAMFDTVAFALSGNGKKALALSLLETPRPNAIDLPGHPETGLTVELGTKLYVALSDTNQVAVIDTQGERLIGLIDDVGDEPWAITAAGGLGYCH